MWIWQTIMLESANESIQKGLQLVKNLGEQHITDEIKNGRPEEFVLDLYCKERPPEVNSFTLLRLYLFSK